MTSWTQDPFWRTSVGFDRLFDLVNTSLQYAPQDAFPPCNILRTGDDRYRISVALAGYRPEQIDLTVHQNTLIITGQSSGRQDDKNVLYRGIGTRDFERRFSLADYVEVTNASLQDGLLQIDLERRLPEAMKPRKIELKTGPTELKSIAAEKAA